MQIRPGRNALYFAPLLVFTSGLSAATLQAEQPAGSTARNLVLGSWRLDVDASIYDPGPAPKEQVRTYSAHLDGIEVEIVTTNSAGEVRTISYVADYDSVEYPVVGATRVSAIVLKKIDDHTAYAELRHGLKQLGFARRVISEDGDTMTIKMHATDRDGRPIQNESVYHRIEP